MFMNPPGVVYVMESNFDDEIKLKWDQVKGARNYLVEYKGNTRSEKWRQADFVSGLYCIITGLKMNRKYKFRVAALNSTERSRWSKTCELDPGSVLNKKIKQ